MTYEATIKISKRTIDWINRIQSMAEVDFEVEGIDEDATILCYTAVFANGYFADIKLCSGQTNTFIDPVMFNPGGYEECVLECADYIEGTYNFEDDEGNEYLVHIVPEEG